MALELEGKLVSIDFSGKENFYIARFVDVVKSNGLVSGGPNKGTLSITFNVLDLKPNEMRTDVKVGSVYTFEIDKGDEFATFGTASGKLVIEQIDDKIRTYIFSSDNGSNVTLKISENETTTLKVLENYQFNWKLKG